MSLMVLSDQSFDFLKDLLDRATPFKGLLEVGADIAGPFVIKAIDSQLLARYIEQGYHDEVDRFVIACENEDLEAAQAELNVLSNQIPKLGFFKSPTASSKFFQGLIGLVAAGIDEAIYRKNLATQPPPPM